MKASRLLFITGILSILYSQLLISQSSTLLMNEYSPISPIAASYSKYGGFSGELYTGNVNISIPIYTIIDGDISLPITLNTTTGAIKVSEIPGWVGSGWNLSLGGAITRKVNHLPDDLTIESYQVGYFYNSVLNNTIYNKLISHDTTLGLWGGEVADIFRNHLDITADDYYFNLPGYSGRFTFFLDSLIVIPHQNIKVEKEFGNGYIKKWLLTMPNGVMYSFEAFDQVEKEFTVDGISYQCITPTTWYLESVNSPKITGGLIEIEYSEENHGSRWNEAIADYSYLFSCTNAPEIPPTDYSGLN